VGALRRSGRGRPGLRGLEAELLDLALEEPVVAPERLDLGRQVVALQVERPFDRPETVLVPARVLPGLPSRERLDPADARRDPALRQDEDLPDVARAAAVRSSAQLLREAGNGDHADAVAVLLPKSATAPPRIASSYVRSVFSTGVLRRIRSLTWRSIARSASEGTAPGKLKSNRRRSGPTYEPAC